MVYKKSRITWLILSFILNSIISMAAPEFTEEELLLLKENKAITQEEFLILLRELTDGTANEKNFYNLKINNKLLNRNYEVLNENGKQYLQLQGFFSSIGFTNYYPHKESTEIFLGTELEEIILEHKKNKVIRAGKEIKFQGDYPKFIIRNGFVYIEKEVFEKIFLNELRIDNQNLDIHMGLNFTPPVAIDRLIDIAKEKLDRESNKKELVFGGKRTWFDLGYVNIDAGYNFSKSSESSKYDRKWDSSISYQGGLLFGELRFDYDLKENEARNFNLQYDQIIENHTLDISRDKLGSDGLWGLRLYKDRGYTNQGGQITISETVPIGSRAQLLYMGVPIEIEDEENGRVTFNSKEIKSNRDYQLKIYYPDGKIVLKDIRTTDDYNKQELGEFEYDININERKEIFLNGNNKDELYKGFDTQTNFYYGLTDKLTLGFGFSNEMEQNVQREKEYLKTLRGNIIYSDTLNGYSYTFRLDGERAFSNFYDTAGKNYSDMNSFGYLTEITKNKWRVTLEESRYAEYYEEKKKNSLNITYDILPNISLDYKYDKTNYYDGKREIEESLGFDVDYAIKGVLLGASADFDLRDSKNNEYSFNAYFGGIKNWNMRLENTWTNNGDDYEVALNLYNNNFKGFIDFSTEFRYSNTDKESFGIQFSMIIDDLITIDASGDKDGQRDLRLGIDKTIDLKNPFINIDSTDVSRANIITFVDQNNNDIYDEGEPLIEGVEVSIGLKKVITNKDGRAKIYGLSNGIEYDLNPKIKKPSYTLGNNKIKILSNFSSEVDVHIPIKPMMNLNGYIQLDKNLGLKPEAREEFYSNIIIQILDEEGKEIDIASPDNIGFFDISGLYPETYLLKVFYIGNDYKILNLNEKLQLKYDKNYGFDFQLLFNVSNKGIELVEKGKGAGL